MGERRAEEEDRHHETGGGEDPILAPQESHKRELGKRVLADAFLGVAALAVGKRALEQRDMLAS